MRAQPFFPRVYTCGSHGDGRATENGHLREGRQQIYCDPIEPDLFAMVLSRDPVEFLSQQDQHGRTEFAAALAELSDKCRALFLVIDKAKTVAALRR